MSNLHADACDNKVRIAVARAGGPTQVAVMLGVANNTVHSWVNNQRVPKITNARKLAGVAGFDVIDLRPVG